MHPIALDQQEVIHAVGVEVREQRVVAADAIGQHGRQWHEGSPAVFRSSSPSEAVIHRVQQLVRKAVAVEVGNRKLLVSGWIHGTGTRRRKGEGGTSPDHPGFTTDSEVRATVGVEVRRASVQGPGAGVRGRARHYPQHPRGARRLGRRAAHERAQSPEPRPRRQRGRRDRGPSHGETMGHRRAAALAAELDDGALAVGRQDPAQYGLVGAQPGGR